MANTQVATRTQVHTKYPQRYNVVFLNDDFTPMAFVINLLIEVFNKNIETAQEITEEIHQSGRAVAGTYNLEIAEQKVQESIMVSRHAGHPLEITYEPV